MLRNDELSDEPLRSTRAEEFAEFVAIVEPRLRRALVALYGSEAGRDATAEALGHAWEHWDRLEGVDNVAGYLFRVAQSRSRRRREPVLFVASEHVDHAFEPQLSAALRALPTRQRLAVVLIHGFDWQASEVAELIGVKTTTVQSHLERGLRRLRKILGVDENGQ